jgi:phage shock protein A
MSMIDRVRASVMSNVNSIAQRLESSTGNVSGLLEQMQVEIKKAKQELLRLVAEEKLLRKQLTERLLESQKWLSRAELAVRVGDDDAAREALLRRKRIAEQAEADGAAADEHQVLARDIGKDIRLMETKFNDIFARKSTLTTTIDRSRAGGGDESLGAGPGSTNFDELARIERALDTEELQTDARSEVEQLVASSVEPLEGDHGVSSSLTPQRKFRVE